MSEPTAPPSGGERRVYVRHPSTPETPFYVVSEQDDILTWKARIRDLSVGGVSLVLNSRFNLGNVLDIGFVNPDTGVARPIPARVVRVESLDDVHWLVACAFLDKLREEELEKLLQS